MLDRGHGGLGHVVGDLVAAAVPVKVGIANASATYARRERDHAPRRTETPPVADQSVIRPLSAGSVIVVGGGGVVRYLLVGLGVGGVGADFFSGRPNAPMPHDRHRHAGLPRCGRAAQG